MRISELELHLTQVVAVVGAEGVGKSSFCYSFSKFLQKRGHSCGVANFDPACRRIKYEAAVDCRDYCDFKPLLKKSGSSEKALEDFYSLSNSDKGLGKSLAAVRGDFLLLDLHAGLDSLLLGAAGEFLSSHASTILYIAGADSLWADGFAPLIGIAAAIEERTGIRTLAVLNKAELLAGRAKRKTLLFQDKKFSETTALGVSALERSGFAQLASVLA